jgi:membrane protease YdiL (CAAX protease family)
MQAYGSVEAASPSLKGAPRVWTSLGLLVAALAVCVPVYGGWLSGGIEDLFRFGMPLLWGGLALVTTRSARLAPFRVLLLCLFGVSLGFALAHIVGSTPVDLLGLLVDTPKGGAVDKIFAEVIPMSAAIFLAAYLARLSLKSLGLCGGRVWLSLGLGLLASVPIVALFAFDPSGTNKAVLVLPATTLLAWFPWIAAFSVANGFMEELWFRGLWLVGFQQAIGRTAAMHVTSIAFCIMHVIVYWREPTAILMLTPVWLYMGYAYAVIVRKTGSLWGAVLAHAIADVTFMYIYFSA